MLLVKTINISYNVEFTHEQMHFFILNTHIKIYTKLPINYAIFMCILM